MSGAEGAVRVAQQGHVACPRTGEAYCLAGVTGWEVTSSDEDSVYLGGDGVQLALVRVPDHQPPTWPGSAGTHLDFHVADLGLAVKQLLELGATTPDFQPGEGQWTVLADPQGHLLCLAG